MSNNGTFIGDPSAMDEIGIEETPELQAIEAREEIRANEENSQD